MTCTVLFASVAATLPVRRPMLCPRRCTRCAAARLERSPHPAPSAPVDWSRPSRQSTAPTLNPGTFATCSDPTPAATSGGDRGPPTNVPHAHGAPPGLCPRSRASPRVPRRSARWHRAPRGVVHRRLSLHHLSRLNPCNRRSPTASPTVPTTVPALRGHPGFPTPHAFVLPATPSPG